MRKRLFLTLTALFCSVLFSRADQDSHFLTKPYLQNPLPNGVTVMWHTKQPAYGWVEYGKTEQLGEKADLVIDGMRNANTTLHKIPLTNLEPGSTYYYRACFKPILEFGAYKVKFSDVVYSETYTYKHSAPDLPVSCVIFNDLHHNYAMFNSLCQVLEGRDYQFSIFNGDCFQDPKSQGGVIKAMTLYNKGVFAHSRPALYIRGNHEIRGAYARHLKENFDFPDNNYFFAMTAGPVRLIFLDCGEDKPDHYSVYSGLNDFTGYREEQQEWLKKEVKSPAFLNAKYRILIHHIPLYNHKDKGISRASRELWSPILDAAPIDLAICGHTHRCTYVPVNTAGNTYPVLIGGGRKIGTGSVMVMSATNERLNIEVLNANGMTVGKKEILASKALKPTN